MPLRLIVLVPEVVYSALDLTSSLLRYFMFAVGYAHFGVHLHPVGALACVEERINLLGSIEEVAGCYPFSLTIKRWLSK